MTVRPVLPILLLAVIHGSTVPAAYSQSTPSSGTISGVVLAPNAKGIGRAVVNISARPTSRAAAFAPYMTSVLTKNDGSFQVTGLADGTYAVCPHLPNSFLLATCTWGIEPLAVLTGGNPTSVRITLQQGADLFVRVDDPAGKVAASLGKVPGALLILAVRTPSGVFVPLPETVADKTGSDHHLNVPVGTALLIAAQSSSFALSDSHGNSNKPALTLPVTIPPGQGQHKEIITVH